MASLSPIALTQTEQRLLVALVEATVPAGHRLKVEASPEHLARSVGLMLASMPWLERWGVRALFFVLEFSALFLASGRFSHLGPRPRDAQLKALVESEVSWVRLCSRLVLTVVKPAHFSRRRVQAAMGYPSGALDGVSAQKTEALPQAQVFERLSGDAEVRCQVVVIGSGAGGGVVAAELAELGVDVVIIEAGNTVDVSALGRDPSSVLRSLYLDGATTMAFGRPSIPLPLGRSVGGTTTINSGTCFRTPKAVLDRWDVLGLNIDRGQLNDCFSKVEKRLSVKAVPSHLLGGSSTVVARGAAALGLEHGPLHRNIRDCKRSAVCAFGCPTNAKQSVNISYIPWALQAGARLYPGVRAKTLLRQDGRAAGVVCRTDTGHTLTVRADVVVSACGAISGVPFLHGLGLRNRNLGRHLTIHPGIKVVAEMPEVVNGWEDTPQGYGISGFQDEGLMFEGTFVPPEYAAIAFPFVGRAFTEVMEAYPHLAMFGFMVADKPVGRVYTVPGGRPFICYSLHPQDKAKVQRGLGVLAEVFFAAGAERIFLPIAGREQQQSLASAQAAIGTLSDPMALEMAAFHPLGTSGMAISSRLGVVDRDLETWEVPGLYVVDGGVVPTSLGVNPQITIMGLATRAAQTISLRFR